MRARSKVVAVLLVIVLSNWVAFPSGENDYPSGASTVTRNEVTSGTVSRPGDPVDWWKVYLPSPGKLVVFLDGEQAYDIDLYFYDNNLNLLGQSTGRGQDEIVYGSIQGGWYYIKVQAYFTSPVAVDYELGALFVTRAAGYLTAGEVDFHSLYMAAGKTYWIFLLDERDHFDPDLYLAYGSDILAESEYTGDLDVIKWTPARSSYYTIAVGGYAGSGYYYILVGSR